MTPISRTLPEKIMLALVTMHEKTPLSSASGLLLCVLNVSLSYTAIMSNIVTVHAVRKTLSLSKNLKTLLLSQAVSDIGVGLVAQPLYVARMILYWSQGTENNPTYFAIMIMHIIASNLFSFATIHGAMALCTDRFMAVHLHLRYQELVTHKRVVGVVILIWALSGFLSFARLWMSINFMYAILAVVISACIVTATFFSVKICHNDNAHHRVETIQFCNDPRRYGVVYRQIHGRSSSPQIPGTSDTQASCWCGNLNLGIERISFIRQAVDVNKFHVRNSRGRYIRLYCNGNFL